MALDEQQIRDVGIRAVFEVEHHVDRADVAARHPKPRPSIPSDAMVFNPRVSNAKTSLLSEGYVEGMRVIEQQIRDVGIRAVFEVEHHVDRADVAARHPKPRPRMGFTTSERGCPASPATPWCSIPACRMPKPPFCRRSNIMSIALMWPPDIRSHGRALR
jgi:hypothetical protein